MDLFEAELTSSLSYREPDLLNAAHHELAKRLRKTLHYGKADTIDGSSLALTELSVDFIREATPRQLGSVDTYFASSVIKQTTVSPCAMILALVYVDRLKHRDPEYMLSVSSSDLFLISMLVASKYLYDEGIEEEVLNEEWSHHELSTADLNQIERQFLTATDWNLYVSASEFRSKLSAVECSISCREARKHGSFTYTQLSVMLESCRLIKAIQAMLHTLCQAVLVCQVSYAAAVLTMVASNTCLVQIRCHVPSSAFEMSTGNNLQVPSSTFEMSTGNNLQVPSSALEILTGNNLEVPSSAFEMLTGNNLQVPSSAFEMSTGNNLQVPSSAFEMLTGNNLQVPSSAFEMSTGNNLQVPSSAFEMLTGNNLQVPSSALEMSTGNNLQVPSSALEMLTGNNLEVPSSAFEMLTGNNLQVPSSTFEMSTGQSAFTNHSELNSETLSTNVDIEKREMSSFLLQNCTSRGEEVKMMVDRFVCFFQAILKRALKQFCCHYMKGAACAGTACDGFREHHRKPACKHLFLDGLSLPQPLIVNFVDISIGFHTGQVVCQ